jgi:hypothetical protein
VAHLLRNQIVSVVASSGHLERLGGLREAFAERRVCFQRLVSVTQRDCIPGAPALCDIGGLGALVAVGNAGERMDVEDGCAALTYGSRHASWRARLRLRA